MHEAKTPNQLMLVDMLFRREGVASFVGRHGVLMQMREKGVQSKVTLSEGTTSLEVNPVEFPQSQGETPCTIVNRTYMY
jgi:hypothetical protein